LGGDATSPGRYNLLTTPSGSRTETYMLDKQTGRLWILRGQVSYAPYLKSCVYQMVSGGTAPSPLDEGEQPETTEDRFVIKSADSSAFAETYVLDKQNGRVWMLRGQLSQAPYLLPCLYQLSSNKIALSPLSSFLPKDRFSMTCIAGGGYAETYVSDIDTGGIWQMRGQVSKAPFLIPCVYQLVNGQLVSTPMERGIEIKSLNQPVKFPDVQDNFGKTAQTTLRGDANTNAASLPP
jgi:hypothetical protein